MTEEEQQAASRGAQAFAELRETEAAFGQVRTELLELIATSTAGDRDLREQCYVGVQVLDRVKAALIAVASGRVVAEHSDLIRQIMAGQDPQA